MAEKILPPSFFAEAANMDTSPNRLAELAHHPDLLPLIAANPATPPHVLEQLSTASDPAIRRAVAQNPNASIQTLSHLAGPFPQEFLDNPIIPILNMTQPNFIKELPFIAWASLLRFADLSLAWLQQIKTDRTYQNRQPAIWRLMQMHMSQANQVPKLWRTEASKKLKEHLQNPSLPAPIQSADETKTFLLFALLFPHCASMLKEAWTDAAHISPRHTGAALSSSKAIGSRTLTMLASTDSSFLLCQVARHPATSPRTLAKLATHNLPAVRQAVAANPRTPLKNLYTLVSESNSTVRRAAASHPALAREDYEILALDSEESVRAALATAPWLDNNLLAQLADDTAAPVRAAVARNTSVDPIILKGLARDPEPIVRAAAAGNPRLPVEAQSVLLTDPEISVRASLSGNTRLPESYYTQLAQDPSPTVRKYLAANPRTPTALLETLWQTGEMEIWQGLAHHPQASPTLLTQLAHQGDARVRAAVAAHKRTPVAVLHMLSQENKYELWSALVRNPHVPLDILEQALATPYTELWYPISNHPTMLHHQRRPMITLLTNKLQQLFATNGLPDWLRKAVFQYSKALPATILELFASSPYWEDRYLAARHPRLAASVLNALAHDGICYVQAAACERAGRAVI